MWRRERGELVSRPLEDDSGRIELAATSECSQTFTLTESAVCIQESESPSSPRCASRRRHHQKQNPPNYKRINSSSSTTDSKWHSTSIHRQSLRLRNIGPPRRCESSELADSPVRTEAIKVSSSVSEPQQPIIPSHTQKVSALI